MYINKFGLLGSKSTGKLSMVADVTKKDLLKKPKAKHTSSHPQKKKTNHPQKGQNAGAQNGLSNDYPVPPALRGVERFHSALPVRSAEWLPLLSSGLCFFGF